MQEFTLIKASPWSPHPEAAPKTARDNDNTYITTANGTRFCSGGWELRYSGMHPGQQLKINLRVRHRNLAQPRDLLCAIARWEPPATEGDADNPLISTWSYLAPRTATRDSLDFQQILLVPPKANTLVLQYILRWTAEGEASWSEPRIAETPPVPALEAVIAVVTGHAHGRKGNFDTIRKNTDYYLPLCRRACEDANPQLIVLPEICLQWGMRSHAFDNAVMIPGPETEPFSALAREFKTHILLPLHERDKDAVHNTAALINDNGEIIGKYRKVHLASNEAISGIMPGDGFPVFDTPFGRVGANICMDSSCAESSRMVGLNGADFLLIPIMGDHRASRWTPGHPIFNEERWKAIMRAHAMDNQFCVVAARNNAHGSCIIDRMGRILAWNEGNLDYVHARVRLDDGYRTWSGGCFREVNWLQRRPHLYGAFVDTGNLGGLRPS